MRKIHLIISILICILFCGCVKNQGYTRHIFFMDTVMDLKVYADSVTAETALTAAENEIKRIDSLLDRKNDKSEIYNINKKKSVNISGEISEIIGSAKVISERTNGAFDITIAPVMDVWGFYGDEFNVPTKTELEKALRGVGYERVRLGGRSEVISCDSTGENVKADNGMVYAEISMPVDTSIDLGGIGKGYTSDRLSEILCSEGITSAVISLGGNVCAIGKRPDGKDWSIGITNPNNKEQLLGTLRVSDKAVVTSGGYERYFERDGVTYHHIIDPSTGTSADSGLISVTVVSDSGITADGLSTALFVMGLEKAIELWKSSDDFEAVFVDTDGGTHITEGIAGAFEGQEKQEIIYR